MIAQPPISRVLVAIVVLVALSAAPVALVAARRHHRPRADMCIVIGLYAVRRRHRRVLVRPHRLRRGRRVRVRASSPCPLASEGAALPGPARLARHGRARPARSRSSSARSRPLRSRALLAPALGRLSGLSAALATFALLVIVYVIARNYEPRHARHEGHARRADARPRCGPPPSGRSSSSSWSSVFQNSRVGLQLRAAREDDVAARRAGHPRGHAARRRARALRRSSSGSPAGSTGSCSDPSTRTCSTSTSRS